MVVFTDRLEIACTALLISLLFGWLIRRVCGLHVLSRALHRISAKLFRRMNRHERADRTRAMRGLVLLAIYCLIAMIAGDMLHLLLALISPSGAAEMLILGGLLVASNVWLPLAIMARAARKNQWPKLDVLLRHLAPGCHADDGHGKLRLAIMLSLQHLTHGVIGSMLCYLMMGMAGLLLYRAVILCATHAPHRIAVWQALGLGIYWVATPLHLISGLITALIAWLAGHWFSRAAAMRALPYIQKNLEAFAAAMLGISLGGNYRAFGHHYQGAWHDFGTAKLTADHALRASLWLAASAALWLAILVVTAFII